MLMIGSRGEDCILIVLFVLISPRASAYAAAQIPGRPPAAQGRNPEREGSCAEFPRWQAVFPVFWYNAITSSRPEIVNQRHCWGAPAAFPPWRRCCCSTSRCRPAPPPPPLQAAGVPHSPRRSHLHCKPGEHQLDARFLESLTGKINAEVSYLNHISFMGFGMKSKSPSEQT